MGFTSKRSSNSFYLVILIEESILTKKKQSIEANYFSGKYIEAKEVFEQLHSAYPNDETYKFRLAICNSHTSEGKKEALEEFKKLEPNKKNLDDFDYHIAYAYYNNYYFVEAKKDGNLTQKISKQLSHQQFSINCYSWVCLRTPMIRIVSKKSIIHTVIVL